MPSDLGGRAGRCRRSGRGRAASPRACSRPSSPPCRRGPRRGPCRSRRRSCRPACARSRRHLPRARSLAAAPRRSSRWSPTRSALAIAVSAGFTALRRREEAGVDHVQVVEVVRLAVEVQHRRRRVGPRSARVPHWCAMPASGIRWSSTEQRGIERLVCSRASPSRPLSLASRRRCGSVVVVGLGEVDRARWRSTVMRLSGCGQILGGEPEVDRVLRHVVERQPGREPRAPARRMLRSRLAEHLDVAERQLRVRRRPSSSR